MSRSRLSGLGDSTHLGRENSPAGDRVSCRPARKASLRLRRPRLIRLRCDRLRPMYAIVLPNLRRAIPRGRGGVSFSWDFRFGHPATVRVLQSTARVQGLRSPLTIDTPFTPVSVAECRSIAAFQLAGGLFADTAPSSSLFSNPASLVRRSLSPVTRLATAAPRSSAACRRTETPPKALCDNRAVHGTERMLRTASRVTVRADD